MSAYGGQGAWGRVGRDCLECNYVPSEPKVLPRDNKTDQRSSVTRHVSFGFPFSLFCLTLFSVLFWSLEFVFVLFVDEDGGVVSFVMFRH